MSTFRHTQLLCFSSSAILLTLTKVLQVFSSNSYLRFTAVCDTDPSRDMISMESFVSTEFRTILRQVTNLSEEEYLLL